MSESVTLKDVAAVAEVSVSTASRVLNGAGRVSDETRERILAAARRLNFRPNALARSFATGRSLTVGILAKDALSTFSMPVLIGASATLGADDLATLTYDLKPAGANDIEKLAKLRSRHVDGVLVVGDGLAHPMRSVTSMFDVPVVYVFGRSDVETDPAFVPDSRMAGRLAGEHLLSIGRRRIAHITASDDVAAEQRESGLLETLGAAGVELALGKPLRGDWTHAWGAEAIRLILDSGEKVDGIFCGDDWIALGAQAALKNAGLRVPQDVAIVGFDNLGRLVDRPARSLTTIDPGLSELGATAVEHLLDIMRGQPRLVGPQFQPCSLVPGASTVGVDASDDGIGGLADL